MKKDPLFEETGPTSDSNRSDQLEPTTPPLPKRPAGNKRQRSIFRVGSQVLTRSKRRMSTYDHVQDAVRYNLQEASGNKNEHVHGTVGLQNLGNTCFLNSSLQCLSNTIPLTDYFLGYDYRKEINKANFLGTGGKLATAYAELMKEMWLGRDKVLKPNKFKHQLSTFAPQFSGAHQHDAQELLAFLLDGIHEDLNRVRKKPYIEDKDCDGTNDGKDAVEAWKNYLRRNKSLVVDIFQGQFRNTCTCRQCGHRNIRFEPFMYLSLPISDSCRTLQDCLELYLQTDVLDGVNQWYCEKCKEHVDATRKIDIWILPPILIIHLKRFKYDDYGQRGSKNNKTLEYPMEQWDLSTFVLGQGNEVPCYDMYAVSNHLGGLGGGHYTAYALNRFKEEWYEYNDSQCRMLEDTSVVERNSTAYLLFYNRCSEDDDSDPSLGRRPLIRRQSVSRPDLWPHAQVWDSDFRHFSRSSRRGLSASSPDSTMKSQSYEEDGDNGQVSSMPAAAMPMDAISEGTGGESSGDLVASKDGSANGSRRTMSSRAGAKYDESNTSSAYLAEC